MSQPNLPFDFIPLALLGAGGEGEVWLAQQRDTGERVAVKRVQLCGSAEMQKQCVEALSRATNLRISGLAVIRRTDVVEDGLWVVSDYIEGRPLSDWQGPMSPISVLRIALQIATTLAQLSSMEVAHGDVSPANIIIDQQGSATLIDLGLLARDSGDSQIDGTPGFSSLCENTTALDRDWHALGALISWLLSGMAVEMPVDDGGRRWSSPPGLPSTSNPLAQELWQLALTLFEAPPPPPHVVVRQLQRLLDSHNCGPDSALGLWSSQHTPTMAMQPPRARSIKPIRSHRWRSFLGILILGGFLWIAWLQREEVYQDPIAMRVHLMAESPRSNLPSGFDMPWLGAQLLAFLPSGSIVWRDSEGAPPNLAVHYHLSVRCLEVLCLMVLGEVEPSSPSFQSILMPEDSLDAWRSALLGLLLSAQIAVQDPPDAVPAQGADSATVPVVRASPE